MLSGIRPAWPLSCVTWVLCVPLCLPVLTRGTEVLVLALQRCPGDDAAVDSRVTSGPREHSVSGTSDREGLLPHPCLGGSRCAWTGGAVCPSSACCLQLDGTPQLPLSPRTSGLALPALRGPPHTCAQQAAVPLTATAGGRMASWEGGPGTFDRHIKYLWAEGLSHIFLYSFIHLGNLRASSRLVGPIFLWPPEDEER